VRRFSILVLLAVMTGCGGTTSDDSSEWLHVLRHKKAAAAPGATARDKQAWADTLGAFVQRHPQHSRAREVYQRIQLDFAHDLASVGRYQDAIRFYRAVLIADPHNDAAALGLRDAVDHLAVSHEKLLSLEKGMSQHEVAKILGKPIPGWTKTNDLREATIESWYYRTRSGGVAGVYFRDGKLFAAEENSSAKLSPLTR
jgi:hypothetical protein